LLYPRRSVLLLIAPEVAFAPEVFSLILFVVLILLRASFLSAQFPGGLLLPWRVLLPVVPEYYGLFESLPVIFSVFPLLPVSIGASCLVAYALLLLLPVPV